MDIETIPRRRVRFSLPDAIDARGVAAQIAQALELHTLTVSGDKDYAASAVFHLRRIGEAGKVRSSYRDTDPRSVWVLDTQDRWVDLEARLIGIGAGDVRKLSEWEE